eukprot:scaffold228009_cov31-Prasinocladus_malaysianus.AAC.1
MAEGFSQQVAESKAETPSAIECIGKRVEVFDVDEELWYRGRIMQYSARTGHHVVRFDHGNVFNVNIATARLRWLEFDARFKPTGHPDEPIQLTGHNCNLPVAVQSSESETCNMQSQEI